MPQRDQKSIGRPTPRWFAIASSRVVTPDGEIAAAIVIENDSIREVVTRGKRSHEIPVTDFGDQIISPGIIDAHVHVNEPGRTEWEGFATATAAAAAGGVTTIIDMPLNSSPVTITAESLRLKRSSAAGQCRVDVGFYGGLIPGHENDLPALIDGGVLGVKAFLCDSGLAEFPAAGEKELRAALEILKPTGVPLLAHAELVDLDLPEITDSRSYQQYLNSRPPRFELAAIELLIRLCREYQTPIHIVHLATAEALPLISAAKKEGLPLTVETCPQYLFFSSDQMQDGQTSFKCAPPIRDEANRLALCQAVTSGLIETIGSDHSPCPPDLKQLVTGDFTTAWGGIASLQLTLPIVWIVGQLLEWTPAMLAERLSARPAEIFGLAKRKGKIEVGYDADLVVWDPAKRFAVQGEKLFHRHSVTPYEGRELMGVVNQTYVRGRLVFDAGKLVGEPVGKLLSRKENVFNSKLIAQTLNSQTDEQRIKTLESCCASLTWIERMLAAGPYENDEELLNQAAIAWNEVIETDLLEAFAAHPRIGDLNSLREKYANTKFTAGHEQSGVDSADEAVLQRLAELNETYFERFGFIFIVCATGKSARQMLDMLQERVSNDRSTELKNAATEQLKITLIRLQKLVA